MSQLKATSNVPSRTKGTRHGARSTVPTKCSVGCCCWRDTWWRPTPSSRPLLRRDSWSQTFTIGTCFYRAHPRKTRLGVGDTTSTTAAARHSPLEAGLLLYYLPSSTNPVSSLNSRKNSKRCDWSYWQTSTAATTSTCSGPRTGSGSTTPRLSGGNRMHSWVSKTWLVHSI